jgi:hypothetical protein
LYVSATTNASGRASVQKNGATTFTSPGQIELVRIVATSSRERDERRSHHEDGSAATDTVRRSGVQHAAKLGQSEALWRRVIRRAGGDRREHARAGSGS